MTEWIGSVAYLLVVLAGGRSSASYGPPIEPESVVSVGVHGTAAAAWLLGVLLPRILRKGSPRVALRRLAVWTVGLTLGMLLMLISYVWLLGALTVEYGGSSVAIGFVLTDQAQKQLQNLPQCTDEALLKAAAGHVEDVWAPWSVRVAQTGLLITFLMFIGMAVANVLFAWSVLKAIKSLPDDVPPRMQAEEL